MDKADWTYGLSERFENGRFVNSMEYSKRVDAGFIERVSLRRFTRRGRLVALKVVVTEHTGISGQVSRELYNRREFVINLRDAYCEELLDGVLRITYNNSQHMMLFPTDYYNFNTWKSWFAMMSPPAKFNS